MYLKLAVYLLLNSVFIPGSPSVPHDEQTSKRDFFTFFTTNITEQEVVIVLLVWIAVDALFLILMHVSTVLDCKDSLHVLLYFNNLKIKHKFLPTLQIQLFVTDSHMDLEKSRDCCPVPLPISGATEESDTKVCKSLITTNFVINFSLWFTLYPLGNFVQNDVVDMLCSFQCSSSR